MWPNQNSYWYDGIETERIWTGAPSNTTFIPGPATGKLFRGLLSFNLDVGTTDQCNQHHATPRFGIGPHKLWTYVASIVTILYDVLWQVVDNEVKRGRKYKQLAKYRGYKTSW